MRILPAYWLALLAVVLLAPWRQPAPTCVANATLTQVYGGGHLLPDFTQTWSLCTEVLFYLAAALAGGPGHPAARPAARLALLAAVVAVNLVWTALAADRRAARPGEHLVARPRRVVRRGDAARGAGRRRRAGGAPDGVAQWRRDFAERPGTVLLLAAARRRRWR